MTFDAPAARASATSRGCRTPPSAQTCPPSCLAAAAHSATAENCGRPTPVIMRVVHIAPGPTPTLTMSRRRRSGRGCPGRRPRCPQPAGRRDRARRPTERVEHLLLVAVSGVDDQHVGAGVDQCLAPSRHIAVDADRGGDPQPARVVHRGGVDAGADRAGAGQDTGQRAVGVRSAPPASTWACSSRSKTCRGVGAHRRGDEVGTATSRSRANRSTSAQAASVTTPIGACRRRRRRRRRGRACGSAPARRTPNRRARG